MAEPDLAQPPLELPCIRCGDCLPACPVGLDPQQLHVRLGAGQYEVAASLGLEHCTACAACDAACPSHIALAVQFRIGRQSLAARVVLVQQAAAARERFELRALRHARESEDRRQRDAELARQANSGDAVAAALERAKARRRPGTPE